MEDLADQFLSTRSSLFVREAPLLYESPIAGSPFAAPARTTLHGTNAAAILRPLRQPLPLDLKLEDIATYIVNPHANALVDRASVRARIPESARQHKVGISKRDSPD